MLHPKVLVSVDGVPVSGVFFERLVSLSVTDREGISTDVLEMTFNNAAPRIASPRRGAVVQVTILGGIGGSFVGSFVVDRVVRKCFPFTIDVRAHSADLRSKMKEGKSKHWDNATVRKIVEEKANDHGLTPKISDKVSGHKYKWFAQQDETDLNFLNRLARRHGALFTIKNGALLWLERGAGETADGTALAPAIIPATSIMPKTCAVSENDVDKSAKVKAFWQDNKKAKRKPVVVPAAPDTTGEHVIREPFSSEAEAKRAAQSKASEMVRGVIETRCSILGQPALMAGQPFRYLGVDPEIDRHEFIFSTVKHSFSKSGGLKTEFEGKLKIAP